MNQETTGFILAAALFAVGAVAVIIYHHAAATQQVLAAVQSAPGPGGGRGAATVAVPSAFATPASLAGSPTPGQNSLGSGNPAVNPLSVGPAWLFGSTSSSIN